MSYLLDPATDVPITEEAAGFDDLCPDNLRPGLDAMHERRTYIKSLEPMRLDDTSVDSIPVITPEYDPEIGYNSVGPHILREYSQADFDATCYVMYECTKKSRRERIKDYFKSKTKVWQAKAERYIHDRWGITIIVVKERR